MGNMGEDGTEGTSGTMDVLSVYTCVPVVLLLDRSLGSAAVTVWTMLWVPDFAEVVEVIGTPIMSRSDMSPLLCGT